MYWKNITGFVFLILTFATGFGLCQESSAVLDQSVLIDGGFLSPPTGTLAENFQLSGSEMELHDVSRVILWGVGEPDCNFTLVFRYDAAGYVDGPTVPGDAFASDTPSCTSFDTGIETINGGRIYRVVLDLQSPVGVSTIAPRWLEISSDYYTYLLGKSDLPVTIPGVADIDPITWDWYMMDGNLAIMLVTDQGIMSDNFEHGTTLATWSSTVPALHPGDEWYMPLTSDLLGNGDHELGTLADNIGGNDDSTCGYGDTIDEWWKIRSCPTGDRVISTCSADTTFDTVITVFDEDRETQYCNDDDNQCAAGTFNSTVTLPAGGSSTDYYYIRVSAYDNDIGNSGEYSLWVGYCTSE